MKQNSVGYRLGLQARRFMRWFSVQENRLQQRGVPDWLVKFPRYLLIAAVIGLLLIGAFYLALFLALMGFIAWCLSAISSDKITENDEYLTGYHAMGPEGPGTYVAGRKVSDEDEDIY
ncbi:DUF3742 family protein [Salmonella enterica]|nr:DUF3742 family protein [Salmonella enterica]EAA9596673.1 DUF3742 family protein [Salmonella enterica]EAO9639202.1 DUF3742 family protein [Salmonella enterica]EKI3325747.1 DUF3742 family protein [Salmonella enterica]HAC8239371.1 DUF3742 family protein [Salmonella enterica]